MVDYRKEVPSLELCKKLKELGYPQDGGGWYWDTKDRILVFTWEEEVIDDLVKAPTVAEMGEWLPPVINLKEGDIYLEIYKLPKNLWILSYCFEDSFICPIAVDGETEANARAKMLICLVENGYVSFESNRDG